MHLPLWLSPPHFEQADQTRLAKNLYNILLSIFLFEIIFSILVPIVFPEDPNPALIFIGIAILYTLACYILMHTGRLSLASLLFCGFLGFSTLGASLDSNGLDSFTIPTFTVVIVIAGLLLGSRYSLTFAILGLICVILIYLVESTGLIAIPQTSFPILLKIAIPAFVFIMSAILLHSITQNLSLALQKVKENEGALETTNSELKSIQATLEQRIENRTAQLEASIEIGQTISNLLDPDELGKQIIQKFITVFAYDFAGIYFLDNTGRWAALRYTNQETLHPFQAEMRRIDLNQPNSITNAIRTQKAYITNDFSKPSERLSFNTLQAPGIRAEITLPLQTSGRLLGALNLQAYQSLNFSPQEVEILQNVANQIASAFENARLFNEAQQQYQEISRLNQFYFQTTWRALLTEKIPAYHLSWGELKEMKKTDHATLEIAHQAQKIHLSNENGTATLIAPIMFQDQVLGALQLTAQDRIWTTDEMVLIEAVLNQTALSLENTRIINETRHRAEQEKLISEVSSRMRETLDLETILQTTAQEMQKTFNLSEVEIRLLPLTKAEPSELHRTISGE